MSSQASAALGPLPPLSDRARRMYRGGIWLVIVAESMIFATLFSTRFLLAGTEHSVGPTDPIGLSITAVLVISLVPAGLALRSIDGGHAAAMSRYLGVVVLLGLAALAIIIFDWRTLSFSPGSAFGKNYVISTGYHAVHILIGAIWLGAASVAGWRGVYTKDNHWVVEGGVLFWSFVVVMWLALYVVFFVA